MRMHMNSIVLHAYELVLQVDTKISVPGSDDSVVHLNDVNVVLSYVALDLFWLQAVGQVIISNVCVAVAFSQPSCSILYMLRPSALLLDKNNNMIALCVN